MRLAALSYVGPQRSSALKLGCRRGLAGIAPFTQLFIQLTLTVTAVDAVIVAVAASSALTVIV